MINKNNIQRSKFLFWTEIKTRWRDMDAIGHLNHTTYLTYMESSRVELYEKLGYPGLAREMDESAILASLEVNYFHQISHPETLEIGNKISRIGNTSYDIDSVILKKNSNRLLCAATFKMVAFNYRKNMAIKVPKIILDAYDKGKC
jgi:acyl-CoA thioester hydrolase